eukprot:TRINITY_DN10907_c0_g1_i2.p1 TRINITY_DN10907_c0_g1~~TRINITY_DN10907_c0_g1_i2.p1  ORF type:complete len:294 (-),score=50.01 TRINITY_DN10907_c0_g1_i2:140-1021(-)
MDSKEDENLLTNRNKKTTYTYQNDDEESYTNDDENDHDDEFVFEADKNEHFGIFCLIYCEIKRRQFQYDKSYLILRILIYFFTLWIPACLIAFLQIALLSYYTYSIIIDDTPGLEMTETEYILLSTCVIMLITFKTTHVSYKIGHASHTLILKNKILGYADFILELLFDYYALTLSFVYVFYQSKDNLDFILNIFVLEWIANLDNNLVNLYFSNIPASDLKKCFDLETSLLHKGKKISSILFGDTLTYFLQILAIIYTILLLFAGIYMSIINVDRLVGNQYPSESSNYVTELP